MEHAQNLFLGFAAAAHKTAAADARMGVFPLLPRIFSFFVVVRRNAPLLRFPWRWRMSDWRWSITMGMGPNEDAWLCIKEQGGLSQKVFQHYISSNIGCCASNTDKDTCLYWTRDLSFGINDQIRWRADNESIDRTHGSDLAHLFFTILLAYQR